MAASVHTEQYYLFLRLLVERRKKIGRTQIEIASRLKRTQSFVSKYERGERRLDFVEFLDVANALEIDVVDFVKKFKRLNNEL